MAAPSKMTNIHASDDVAEELIRHARVLISGRDDAPFMGDVEIRIRYFPRLSGRAGFWIADIPVKPAGRKGRRAFANGSSPNDAVQRLLRLVEAIPVTPWSS